MVFTRKNKLKFLIKLQINLDLFYFFFYHGLSTLSVSKQYHFHLPVHQILDKTEEIDSASAKKKPEYIYEVTPAPSNISEIDDILEDFQIEMTARRQLKKKVCKMYKAGTLLSPKLERLMYFV